VRGSREYEIASSILIFNEAKRENCNCEYCNGNFCPVIPRILEPEVRDFLGMARVTKVWIFEF
ncbi:MAG: hypothetical protein JXR36_04330, partial [Bacteroidales bacterium]|nr:hypothetical protein [Bacteroidales bacterium]